MTAAIWDAGPTILAQIAVIAARWVVTTVTSPATRTRARVLIAGSITSSVGATVVVLAVARCCRARCACPFSSALAGVWVIAVLFADAITATVVV